MPKALKVFVPPHRRIPANNRQRCGDPFYSHKAWRATRAAVLTRDEYTCHYCGCELHGFDATVDHVRARAAGGDDYNPANLVAACRRCNSRKGDRPSCPRSVQGRTFQGSNRGQVLAEVTTSPERTGCDYTPTTREP